MKTNQLKNNVTKYIVVFSTGVAILGISIITYSLLTRSQSPELSMAGSVPKYVCNENIISDDFSAANYDNNWTIWHSLKDIGSATESNGTINMQIGSIPNATSGQVTGLSSKFKMSGNFALEIGSKLVSQTVGKKQGVVSVALMPVVPNASSKRAVIVRNVGTSKIGWQWNPSDSDWNSQTSGETETLTTLTDNKEVMFKFSRENQDINLYYDMGEGAGYQLLKTIPSFSDQDLIIMLLVSTWGPDYPQTQASFDNLKACKTVIATSTPTATITTPSKPTTLISDLDMDGELNIIDFGIFVRYYAQNDAKADFNSDGLINISDFTVFKDEYIINNK